MAIVRARRPVAPPAPLPPAKPGPHAATGATPPVAATVTQPSSKHAEGQRRYQLRRLCHHFIVHGSDPLTIRAGILEKHGLDLSEEQILALVAETRAWQLEQHAARKRYAREDAVDRHLLLLPTLQGAARVQAEANLAKLLGVEAPVEIRMTHEMAPEILEVLGASSPEEVARYVARALAKKGDGEK